MQSSMIVGLKGKHMSIHLLVFAVLGRQISTTEGFKSDDFILCL